MYCGYSISFEPVDEPDLPVFVREVQEAFAVAVRESFGPCDDPIPPDEDVWSSMRREGAETYHVMLDGRRVRGVVVAIDDETRRNSLDLFFISPDEHNRGLGLATWKAIEDRYPDTEVWETVTPYFERRNINFYVNKCGFHIVEFFNEHHPEPGPHRPVGESGAQMPGTDAFFRFEKRMARMSKGTAL